MLAQDRKPPQAFVFRRSSGFKGPPWGFACSVPPPSCVTMNCSIATDNSDDVLASPRMTPNLY